MAKHRTIQQLAQEWDNLINDDQLVAFIDSLTDMEVYVMDRAIAAGTITPEPLYLTKEVA